MDILAELACHSIVYQAFGACQKIPELLGPVKNSEMAQTSLAFS